MAVKYCQLQSRRLSIHTTVEDHQSSAESELAEVERASAT